MPRIPQRRKAWRWVTFRCDLALWEAARSAAKANGITLQSIINDALSVYLWTAVSDISVLADSRGKYQRTTKKKKATKKMAASKSRREK